ncbi:MAG: hypothetical protein R6V55_01345 [Desulfovermiculus sp.]
MIQDETAGDYRGEKSFALFYLGGHKVRPYAASPIMVQIVGAKLVFARQAKQRQASISSVIPAQGGNQEQIERLSPRLPGKPHPGMFEGSGPGNDKGTETRPPCVSYLINPANSAFLPALGHKIFQICRRQS